jgi:AraC family transcriptional activator of pobA
MYKYSVAMKQPKDIQYVELANNEMAELSASFFLRRFVGETFRPPVSYLPHRHNYHEIFVVQSGHGQHAIDGQSTDLLPCTVSLITKGQVHIVEHLTELTGWLIRFTDDFLPAGFTSQTWNYHATLFNQLGYNHTLTIQPSDVDALGHVLDLMESEWIQAHTFQQESVLRHLLSVLIIRLERIYQNSLCANQLEREEYRVYQQFMTLLEYHFAHHHDVQYYATALQIAPIKLSRILSRIVGKPTKQMIDEWIVLEAKRYLQYTDLSIKEIAFALGYSDLFHFSKTFKRLAGIAPQAFRAQRQKLT